MTFRRSNQKPRTKKSHVMEQIFLSSVKNTKNSQRIREATITNNVSHILFFRIKKKLYSAFKKMAIFYAHNIKFPCLFLYSSKKKYFEQNKQKWKHSVN